MKIEAKQVMAYQVGTQTFGDFEAAARCALAIVLEPTLMKLNAAAAAQTGRREALAEVLAAAIYEQREEVGQILRQAPPLDRAAEPR